MSPLEAREEGIRHEVQRTWVTRQSARPIPGITGPAFSLQVGHTHSSPRGDREPFSPALALSAAPQTPSEGLSQPHRCLPRIWLETGSVTPGAKPRKVLEEKPSFTPEWNPSSPRWLADLPASSPSPLLSHILPALSWFFFLHLLPQASVWIPEFSLWEGRGLIF